MTDSMLECWVFDVDGCMVDSLTGASLRPGAWQLLTDLGGRHHTLVWWSAGGADYARRRAEQLGIDHLIDGFYGKDLRDDDGRYSTAHFLAPGQPAIFVDDRPEDLPLGSRVIEVSPDLAEDPHDRGLHRAAQYAERPHGAPRANDGGVGPSLGCGGSPMGS